MREVLVRNLASQDKRRKELFLSEHFENEGKLYEIEKRTIYKVRAVLDFTSEFDLQLFIDQKLKEESNTQRFIIKKRDKRSGRDGLFYKVTGEQFVMLKDKVLVLKISQYVKKTIIHKDKAEQFLGSHP